MFELYAGNDSEKIFIGAYDTLKELHKAENEYIALHYGKCYYTRMWLSDEYLINDYGSWTDFLYVTNSERNPQAIMDLYLSKEDANDV